MFSAKQNNPVKNKNYFIARIVTCKLETHWLTSSASNGHTTS